MPRILQNYQEQAGNGPSVRPAQSFKKSFINIQKNTSKFLKSNLLCQKIPEGTPVKLESCFSLLETSKTKRNFDIFSYNFLWKTVPKKELLTCKTLFPAGNVYDSEGVTSLGMKIFDQLEIVSKKVKVTVSKNRRSSSLPQDQKK